MPFLQRELLDQNFMESSHKAVWRNSFLYVPDISCVVVVETEFVSLAQIKMKVIYLPRHSNRFALLLDWAVCRQCKLDLRFSVFIFDHISVNEIHDGVFYLIIAEQTTSLLE